ncbi:GNAT family N-acetyltransferase [Acidobacteriota bacterium]
MDIHFPMSIRLADGTPGIIRPLEERDAKSLFDMFKSLKSESRKYLYDNVSDFSVVEGWCRNKNYCSVLPLILEVDSKIVADGTLHRRPNGPLRHVGRIRVVVKEDYRDYGFGRALVEILIDCARTAGLKLLSCTLADEETTTIKRLEELGFHAASTIPDYLMDPDGNTHSMITMLRKLD